MEVVILAGIAGLILLLAGFAVLFAKLRSLQDENFSPADILNQEPFAPERYRAMERLLTDEGLVSSDDAKNNVRKVRIAVLRGYVQMLSEDFNRISKLIRLHMMTSEVDRSELAGVLMQQRLRFFAGLMQVEYKMLLYRFGWESVEAGGLIRSLDGLRAQLQALSALAVPAAA